MVRSGMKGNVEAQLVRLRRFSQLLDRMFLAEIKEDETSLSKMVLLASILRAKQTARAAELVAQSACVEEVQAMSRTLVEVTVNASYLQHTSSREVQRYLHYHPEQTQARGLLPGRQGKPPGLAQRLGAILNKMSSAPQASPAGSGWSLRSLLDRAQMADDASGIPIMSLLVRRCYPKGHAASIGAVASLETFLGAVSTMQLPGEESRLAELAEALFAINLCLLTLSLYLNTVWRLGLDAAIDEAANAKAPTYPEPAQWLTLDRSA